MKQVFEIAPAGSGVFWFWGATIGLFVVLLALFCYMAWSMNQVRFEIDGGELRLRGDLWGRTLATHSLKLDEAEIVDLGGKSPLRPRGKTMGSAIPGYKSGWFRLANGDKALVYLTDSHRAVYIPTHEGYSLLLSPKEPDRFLSSLRGNR